MRLIYKLALLPAVLLAPGTLLRADNPLPTTAVPSVIVDTTREPVSPGPFQPTWQSLGQYQAPDWFRDAKFGIWAHWGAQCEPEAGDWYARGMYGDGKGGQSRFHRGKYGHPSEFGFKDVIHQWKAEKWDPDRLVALYKRVGAQYFFAMANHHDNFDNWDSRYQPWNSVAIGPRKDIIAGWARAAHAQGLPFGVSVHAAHAWSWYEVAQGTDKDGPKAGMPYDGKLTKADGQGKWWEGLDPQDLYAQSHVPGTRLDWNWDPAKGSSTPDQTYCDKFYNRTADLINKYKPDLLYFDDTALPLWPVSDAGLQLAADFYNTNLARTGGKSPGVLFGKILDEQQRKCLVWDIERGVPATILPFAWQTDTCIGQWHYDRGVYNKNSYKSATTVIHLLADIISKNGNLLLNIPVRGDGSIDEKEENILEDIARWMDVNKEAVFGTRPWKTFGEGPASEGVALSDQGFNEGKRKPLTADDVRFTTRAGVIYAIVLGVPTKPLSIRSLGAKAGQLDSAIDNVVQLGSPSGITWKQTDDALTIEPPPVKPASDAAVVYKITPR